MELDVSKIKRTQPLAVKTKPGDQSKNESSLGIRNGPDINDSSANRSPGKIQNQRKASKELDGRRKDEKSLDKRPETSVGKNRGASLGSSNVSSEEARQPPPNHIPLIVCDEITEGDTQPQTRGFDTGVSADNLLLQCTEPESDIEVSIQEIENEGRTFNFGKQSRIPKDVKDYSPSQAKDLARKSSAADDDPDRITSARSRRGSEYGHGSPKRQGESYVERLAKSRVRNSASQRPKDQQNSVQNEILEADDIYFAKFLEQQSYAKRGLWNSTNFSKHASQFHSTLADLVSEDIRQSPHRSMSFTSSHSRLLTTEKPGNSSLLLSI